MAPPPSLPAGTDSDEPPLRLHEFVTQHERLRRRRGAFTEPAVLRSETTPPQDRRRESDRPRSEEAADHLESQDVLAIEGGTQDSAVITVDLRNNPCTEDVAGETAEEDITEEAPVEEACTEQNARESHVVSLRFDYSFSDEDIREDLPRTFYFCLTALHVAHVRSFAKDLGVKQGYSKSILVAKVFLSFMQGYRNGETELGLLLTEENEGTFNFFKEKLAGDYLKQEMPSAAHLEALAAAESRDDAPVPHETLKLRGIRRLSAMMKSERDEGKNVKAPKLRGKKRKSKSSFTRYVRPRRLFHDDDPKEVEGTGPAEGTAADLEQDNAGNTSTVPASQEGPTGDTVADPNGNATENSRQAPPMSISEFALLMVLLKEDEECRRALLFLSSSQVLTRQQLDRGERSGDFWNTVVAHAFNDNQTRNHFDFSPVLPDVDPSLPAAVHRSGEQLHTALKSFRAKFMNIYYKYNCSGQNNPDFKTFVEGNGLRGNSALGKRIILVGFLLGIGTLHADDAFLQSLGRTIGCRGQAGGQAGYDARMSQEPDDSSSSNDLFISGNSGAKKGNLTGIIQEKYLKALSAITSCAKKYDKYQKIRIASAVDKRSEASPATAGRAVLRGVGTPSRGSCARVLEKDKILTSQIDLLKSLSEARQHLRESSEDERMAQLWEGYITKLDNRLEELNGVV